MLKRNNPQSSELRSKIEENPLQGPFPYDQKTINSVIPNGVIGNYILGNLDENGDFQVLYVGRSDSDLRGRIGHKIGKYSHFCYSIAQSPREAYNQECLLWHTNGGDEEKLDNKIHPDKPDGDDEAECFICRMKEEYDKFR